MKVSDGLDPKTKMLPIRMDVGLGSLKPVSTIVRSPWWTPRLRNRRPGRRDDLSVGRCPLRLAAANCCAGAPRSE